jgi:hypothetical protein
VGARANIASNNIHRTLFNLAWPMMAYLLRLISASGVMHSPFQ